MKTEAPRYTTGHSINMAMTMMLLILSGCHSIYAKIENKKREEGKRDINLANEAEGLGHDHPSFRFTP
jgi:hypothetical protein